MKSIHPARVTPFLWFDGTAEAAAAHYTAIFPRSAVTRITRYEAAGARVSGQPEGSVMTVAFTLDGQDFVALNGGPRFPFTCAVSFAVHCETQEEIDDLWEQLAEGGDPAAQQCGWLADRFGLSWQVVPSILPDLLAHPDPAVRTRTMEAVLAMKKPNLATILQAAGL